MKPGEAVSPPSSPTEEKWREIQTRLFAVGDLLQEIAQDAAELVATVPTNDRERKGYGPRKSTVKAAQFVAALDYTAQECARRATAIEVEEVPDA